MAYFKEKPSYVKAWQYDGLGKRNAPQWFLDIYEEYECDLTISVYDDADDAICINACYTVHVGDWIILDKNDVLFSLTDDEFKDAYEYEGGE